MTTLQIKYGRKLATCNVPDNRTIHFIHPPSVKAIDDPALQVKKCLTQPLGNVEADILGENTTVAIAINDKTRPVPHPVLLPPLLEWPHGHGVLEKNITFFIASGTHTPMSPDEYSLVLPKALIEKYPVKAHNCLDNASLKYLGETNSNHTPVWVNKDYAEADYRIVIGSIEPHHFMGFSGGVKTAAIGLTGLNTIQNNHSLMIHPNCTTGRIVDNPMRQDVEEIGKMIGIHLAVNAVLDDKRDIVSVYAGDPQSVFAFGTKSSRDVCQTSVKDTYNIVIASAGGYPKDINFYQAQKAMSNAAMITRKNGCLILAAECVEGAGSKGFTDFMYGSKSATEVMHKFAKTPFAIGMHKAFLTCRILEKITVILVSALYPETVRSWHMTPASSLQEGLDIALSLISLSDAEIAVMPYAVNTIPMVPLS